MNKKKKEKIKNKKFISAETFRLMLNKTGLTTTQLYESILTDPDFDDYNTFLDKKHYKEFLKYKKYVYEILKVDENGNPIFPKPNHLILKRVFAIFFIIIGLPFKLFSYIYLLVKALSNVTYLLRLFCCLFIGIIPVTYCYALIKHSAIDYCDNISFSNMFHYVNYDTISKEFFIFLVLYTFFIHIIGNLFYKMPCDEFDMDKDKSFYFLGYLFNKGMFYFGFLLFDPLSYEDNEEQINYSVNCYHTKLSRFLSEHMIFNDAAFINPSILYEQCKECLPYLNYIPEFDNNGYDQYGLDKHRRLRTGEQM